MQASTNTQIAVHPNPAIKRAWRIKAHAICSNNISGWGDPPPTLPPEALTGLAANLHAFWKPGASPIVVAMGWRWLAEEMEIYPENLAPRATATS